MSWGVSLRNAVGLGLGGIPSLLNAPPYARLAFNFLSGELDPRITFSRTSNATLIGSDGTLQYAPHNLLTYSEQFDNAAWTKAQSTISANSIAAPDGTATADKLVEDATNSQHVLFRSTSIVANTPFAASGYFKAGERTRINFRLLNGTFNSGANVTFDLSAGTTPFSSLVGTATNLLFSITPVGNGWYRCAVSCVVDTTSTTGVWAAYLVNTGNNDTYLGDGTSGIYAWGAQLNVGALQPYYSTTVKNLLGYSQEFDNAAWTKSNSTTTADVTAAPDGSMTADKLVEDTATSNHLTQSNAVTVISGSKYTVSVYAKASQRSQVRVALSAVEFANGRQALFDLQTGTVVAVETGATATVVSIGNGWYRCAVTATASASGSNPVTYQLANGATTFTPQSYTGDGTSGIFIWGAQLSDSASLDPYVYNPAAAPSNTAYYGPRRDYDPVTLLPKGMLIEEQRTNICLYSSDLNQANWLKNPISILMSYDSTSAPDGTTTADTITVLNGTDTGVYQSIACSSSTTYTFSLYVKLGTMAASDYRIAIYDNTNSAFIAADIIPTQTPSSTAWTRVTYTFTTPATCVSVRVYCFRNGASAATSVNVWGIQLEQGAFATSYIPTTTAAATRAADVLSITGANFSSWYNQAEGTVVVEPTLTGSRTSDSTFFRIDDGTNNNRIQSGTGASFTVLNSFIISGGVSQGTNVVSVSPTVASKSAFAFATNISVAAANGTVGTTDTTVTVPTGLNRLLLGRDDTVGYLNGHIRSFKYYPTRLSNGQLQTLTK